MNLQAFQNVVSTSWIYVILVNSEATILEMHLTVHYTLEKDGTGWTPFPSFTAMLNSI